MTEYKLEPERHIEQESGTSEPTNTDTTESSGSENLGLTPRSDGGQEIQETGSETGISTYKQNNLGLTTETDNTSGLTQSLEAVGASDDRLAHHLYQMATNAFKEIHIGDGETITIPDNRIRLDATKLILQAKGHLREKGNTIKAEKHITYILGN